MWSALLESSRIMLEEKGQKVWSTQFYLMDIPKNGADKNILIPVVDLHDCEVIYDSLGVFWETSYVDTDNRIKFLKK